ncbi:hypothetical protein P5673_020118 [Acropora cervicornis]|uniref:Uncharacterized protein n=1 Tax=Acropora cervicornis TaxID=6130 RepID=A0AAD9QAI6_ACRCE|nr:hypothetical protein P5673_020118 [Acropora cervicornis]
MNAVDAILTDTFSSTMQIDATFYHHFLEAHRKLFFISNESSAACGVVGMKSYPDRVKRCYDPMRPDVTTSFLCRSLNRKSTPSGLSQSGNLKCKKAAL